MAVTISSQNRWVGWRLQWIRGIWLLFFVLSLLVNLISVPYTYRQQVSEPTTDELPIDNSETFRALLREAGITTTQYALYTLLIDHLHAFLVLGAALLIFVHRSSDRGALVISLLLMTQAVQSGGALIEEAIETKLASQIFYVIGASSFILFFMFPNGRFVPRWTRWVALAFVGMFILEAFSSFKAVETGWIIPLGLLGIATTLYAQVYRYRKVSGPVERRQTRWAMLGLIMTPIAWLLTAFTFVFFPVVNEASSAGLQATMIGRLITLPFYMMGPIGITIALLRYRLYDVDVVIRRTLIYSSITVLLALVYFGGVAVMQNVFHALTGQESPLAVVASTLAIAALFTPVRRRVQDVVDRRFFRRKYDAERTVDQFARAVRDEVDVDRLRGALLGVVEETMQPEYVSLWVRE